MKFKGVFHHCFILFSRYLKFTLSVAIILSEIRKKMWLKMNEQNISCYLLVGLTSFSWPFISLKRVLERDIYFRADIHMIYGLIVRGKNRGKCPLIDLVRHLDITLRLRKAESECNNGGFGNIVLECLICLFSS